MKKRLINIVVGVVMTLFSVFSMFPAQPVAAADAKQCGPNSVITCGAFSEKAVKDNYNKRDNAKIYKYFGIQYADIKGMKDGYVYKNGNITVGLNQVVATGAQSAGRSKGINGRQIPGTSAYIGTTQNRFKTDKLQAFVKLDANGRFMWAIIKACGNPSKGTPTFKAKPNFKVVKKVKKAGTKDLFADSVTAAPGTRLEYVIAVQNTGNIDIKNVLVKDILPKDMKYDVNSAHIVNSNGQKGKIDNKVMTTGYKIPELKKGGTAFIFFTATLPQASNPVVKVCDQKTKLTNKAHVDPVGPLGPKEDTADAYTCKPKETPKTPNYEMQKDVRVKDGEWTQDVTVAYGETVEYRILVKNTGDTDIKNVLVKDMLPAGVEFVRGSLKVNGKTVEGDLFGKGVILNELKKGTSVELTFEAVVHKVAAEECKDGAFRNRATTKPEGLGEKEDDAFVNAECDAPEECKPGIPVGDERCKETPEIPEVPETPETPDVPVKSVPKTGMGSVISGVMGVSSIAYGIASFLRSRRSLRSLF